MAWVVEESAPNLRRKPSCKRPAGSAISVTDSDEDSSGSGERGRPVAKKARSDTAVGGPGPSRPKPRPKGRPEVVLTSRRDPATFDPVRDVQQLREEILSAIATVLNRWGEMAQANVLQGKGRGKERVP
jgi:hypothetical protein